MYKELTHISVRNTKHPDVHNTLNYKHLHSTDQASFTLMLHGHTSQTKPFMKTEQHP